MVQLYQRLKTPWGLWLSRQGVTLLLDGAMTELMIWMCVQYCTNVPFARNGFNRIWKKQCQKSSAVTWLGIWSLPVAARLGFSFTTSQAALLWLSVSCFPFSLSVVPLLNKYQICFYSSQYGFSILSKMETIFLIFN